jgi:FixJ family two-component response regulator
MAAGKRKSFVAIVDDDPSIRQAIESLLASAGIENSGYVSAEQFLRSPRARTAACLILDMQLPGMNGLQLCQELRAAGIPTPIVLVTADTDRGGKIRTAALAAGVMAVLHKPFEPDALLGCVQEVLANAKRR